MNECGTSTSRPRVRGLSVKIKISVRGYNNFAACSDPPCYGTSIQSRPADPSEGAPQPDKRHGHFILLIKPKYLAKQVIKVGEDAS